jgi:hypothetical protein
MIAVGRMTVFSKKNCSYMTSIRILGSINEQFRALDYFTSESNDCITNNDYCHFSSHGILSQMTQRVRPINHN